MPAIARRRPRQFKSILLAATLLAAATSSHAAIRTGDSMASGVAAGHTPELFLILWDPVKEVSYTKDLGINVYRDNYASGDPSTNLFVYGQQEQTYQNIFAALNTDANFTRFLARSTDQANQVWGVFASSLNGDLTGQGGEYTGYLTINHETPTGVVNPQYTALMGWKNGEFNIAQGNLQSFEAALNQGNSSSQLGGQPDPLNTHGCATCATNYVTNGSSFNVKGELQYAGAMFSSSLNMLGSPASPKVLNKVGYSSWFYTVTNSTDDTDQTVSVDEFDNLAHDAYWGLGVDSNGNYILSYTMQGSLTMAQTQAGALLRLRTEYSAAYGTARLIDLPGDPFSGVAAMTAVTAVPEPATWGLMGLGLAAVAARARRRQG